MKKQRSILLGSVLAGFIWSPMLLVAQVDTLELHTQLQQAQEEVQSQLENAFQDLENTSINMNLNDDSRENLQFGLYLENLDFEEAYERHYPYNYGVLVSGVVNGGNADRAGIVKGDIIMEFDGEKVRYEDHLLSLRDSKKFGDTVALTIFRNENIIERSLTFSPRAPKTRIYKDGKMITEKSRISPGYGGGGPLFVSVDFDFPEVSKLLVANGFDALTGKPVTFYGGYGMGNVGHGLFIGGGGAGFTADQQIQKSAGTGYKRYLLESGYGGVMIHKKKALFTKKLVLDLGLLLGGGSTSITVSSTDGGFSWNSDIENNINSESFKYQKDYFVYQPSIGVLVRITDWFGIDANVGYMGTYAKENSWKEANFDFSIDDGNPELFNSLSYSVGLWFGY
ncbi:MAG: PDZ domain-containing protein [FCB group bacterium]|nr:PDZ domain-containing protein [FCB group bacterium]